MAKLVQVPNGFWIEEGGDKSHSSGLPELDDSLCESEEHLNWQKQHFGDGKSTAAFEGSEQTVLVGPKSLENVTVISYCKIDGEYQGLVRTAKGYQRVSVPEKNIPYPWFRRWFGLGPNKITIANTLAPATTGLDLRETTDEGIAEALIKLDETQVHRTFKFGVLYRGPGQQSEEDMFNNDAGSPAYEEFLSILGDKIALNGWKRFRGDLDVKTDTTGKESVFTEWRGYQVMFHVATLLPKMKNDRQQVERKRHLGNDIVLVVFQDQPDTYNASTVVSHQNHVVFLITPENNDFYRVEVAAKNGVKKFGPALPSTFLIPKSKVSHDYLLNKLINAERASYGAEGFESRVQKVRESLVRNVVSTFLK